MTARTLLLACALAALLAGCAADAPQPVRKPAARAAATRIPQTDLSAYRLGIGDKLRIDVYGEPDLSIETVIDGTGNISYPLLGAVPARLKTAHQLEELLKTSLASGYLIEPDVRVSVVQYRPFYTIGQVKRPGPYPYVLGITVEKAIAIAGGLTTLASTRNMFLLRENATTQSQRIKVGLDAVVLPGDTLLVEEGLF
jgi:protein involved in polysaccharide export with SLBB domain